MFSHIHFQSIPVADPDRALGFYRDTMGFAVTTDAPYDYGPHKRWIFLEIPGGQTLLHFGGPRDGAPPKTPNLILVTADVDAACDTLTARGITIVNGPEDAPWAPGTRWAMIRDTEDNLILIQTI